MSVFKTIERPARLAGVLSLMGAKLAVSQESTTFEMPPPPPLWAELVPLLLLAVVIVSEWAALSWCIGKQSYCRNRKWFRYGLPSGMVIWLGLSLLLAFKLPEWVGMALALGFIAVNAIAIVVPIAAMLVLQLLFGEGQEIFAASAGVVLFWLSWYEIVRLVERRHRDQIPLSLLATPSSSTKS